MPQQGVIGTNIELPGVSLRSAPGYDLAGPSVRMGNPNRSAVTSTQPWVKPTGVTHGSPSHPPLRSSYPLFDIDRGFAPTAIFPPHLRRSGHNPYIVMGEKRPEGVTDHSPRQRLG